MGFWLSQLKFSKFMRKLRKRYIFFEFLMMREKNTNMTQNMKIFGSNQWCMQEHYECQDEHQEHFEDQDEHQDLFLKMFSRKEKHARHQI